MKAVDKDNLTAIIFYLKTQGKHLGYVERQEVSSPDDAPLRIEIEYVNSPITPPDVSSRTSDD